MTIRFEPRIEKWEKTIVFQVLGMDKRFRWEIGDRKEFTAANGFIISSLFRPSIITHQKIFLWGQDKSADQNVTTMSFLTNELRDTYCNRMVAALADWLNGWEGWNEGESDEMLHR